MLGIQFAITRRTDATLLDLCSAAQSHEGDEVMIT